MNKCIGIYNRERVIAEYYTKIEIIVFQKSKILPSISPKGDRGTLLLAPKGISGIMLPLKSKIIETNKMER